MEPKAGEDRLHWDQELLEDFRWQRWFSCPVIKSMISYAIHIGTCPMQQLLDRRLLYGLLLIERDDDDLPTLRC